MRASTLNVLAPSAPRTRCARLDVSRTETSNVVGRCLDLAVGVATRVPSSASLRAVPHYGLIRTALGFGPPYARHASHASSAGAAEVFPALAVVIAVVGFAGAGAVIAVGVRLDASALAQARAASPSAIRTRSRYVVVVVRFTPIAIGRVAAR